ncbi:uncharacterized protein LOC105398726 [Plutella xylostella]|uniref:uncharacterized protein LOC105398726 n=1 Tax=Plutella xylostella TaxID=51655 RepID=UPI0020328C79|nr:uncharacterized protein LOC105398726 [Plutella xylostella]XP_048477917.1 uncharacterized protein LOC105398726 [Plutella xylostella]
MTPCWLLFTFSWFGSASLQFINPAGPGADDTALDPGDPAGHYPPLPYRSYDHLPPANSEPMIENSQYITEDQNDQGQRPRRTTDLSKDWMVDQDRQQSQNDLQNMISNNNPLLVEQFEDNENVTLPERVEVMDPEAKKNFSPWGGKRDKSAYDQMWTWKRQQMAREPSMPKRVRFSPWGGKRSGHMIFKPGTKSNRVLYSTNLQEMARFISNLSPKDVKVSGIQLAKRHPLRMMTLAEKTDPSMLREAMPFQMFLDYLPKLFKTGHPYSQVNLKKDGKRKVKFSAWGGKRSPPIIGPIWTPTSADAKDASLDAILLLRNNGHQRDLTATTY